jgi:hypothetical protein
MAKFLILTSPNKSNVGTIAERSEDFYKPSFYKISEEELNQFVEMNTFAKSAFIAEKLQAQIGTPADIKKKVVPSVEVVESKVESVSVEMPEVEIEEPLNEPINEVEVSHIGLTSPTVKAKGRPKKTN